MKKQANMSNYSGILIKISIFSILFALVICNSAFSGEKKEKSECYKQIDSLLAYDDVVKVTDNDGYKYSGTLIKVREDSIMIRYIPVKFQQSPVLRSIMITDIAKIESKGIRTQSTFLPKPYTRLLALSAGLYWSATYKKDENKISSNLPGQLLRIGIAMVIGEIISHSAVKKMPIDITIQCK